MLFFFFNVWECERRFTFPFLNRTATKSNLNNSRWWTILFLVFVSAKMRPGSLVCYCCRRWLDVLPNVPVDLFQPKSNLMNIRLLHWFIFKNVENTRVEMTYRIMTFLHHLHYVRKGEPNPTECSYQGRFNLGKEHRPILVGGFNLKVDLHQRIAKFIHESKLRKYNVFFTLKKLSLVGAHRPCLVGLCLNPALVRTLNIFAKCKKLVEG